MASPRSTSTDMAWPGSGAPFRPRRARGGAPRCGTPVVRMIPETGRKALYVCRLVTDRINELAPAESRALIDELCDHIENRKLVYDQQRRVGDILIWDTRCPSHARTDFSADERRLLKRVTASDNVPPLQR